MLIVLQEKVAELCRDMHGAKKDIVQSQQEFSDVLKEKKNARERASKFRDEIKDLKLKLTDNILDEIAKEMSDM